MYGSVHGKGRWTNPGVGLGGRERESVPTATIYHLDKYTDTVVVGWREEGGVAMVAMVVIVARVARVALAVPGGGRWEVGAERREEDGCTPGG